MNKNKNKKRGRRGEKWRWKNDKWTVCKRSKINQVAIILTITLALATAMLRAIEAIPYNVWVPDSWTWALVCLSHRATHGNAAAAVKELPVLDGAHFGRWRKKKKALGRIETQVVIPVPLGMTAIVISKKREVSRLWYALIIIFRGC